MFAFFPQLQGQKLEFNASTVRDLVDELDRSAPGLAFYLCDELGRLRRHVNVFVDRELLMDRVRLSDELRPDSEVFIAQALSGG